MAGTINETGTLQTPADEAAFAAQIAKGIADGEHDKTDLADPNIVGKGPPGNRWNFPTIWVDPKTIFGDRRMGPVPLHSQYQCYGRKRGSSPPRRCLQWSLTHSRYCKWHGGRQAKPRRGTRVSQYYSKLAGPTLGLKLQELAQLSPDERYALCDEVDAARVMCEKAMRYFDATHFAAEGAPPLVVDTEMREAQTLAQELLRRSLDFVGNMVTKAAKTRAVNIGTVDVEQLAYIVDQVGRIVEEEIAVKNNEGTLEVTGRAMADLFVEKLKAVKMPERSTGIGNDPAELATRLREAAAAVEGSVVVEPEENFRDGEMA